MAASRIFQRIINNRIRSSEWSNGYATLAGAVVPHTLVSTVYGFDRDSVNRYYIGSCGEEKAITGLVGVATSAYCRGIPGVLLGTASYFISSELLRECAIVEENCKQLKKT